MKKIVSSVLIAVFAISLVVFFNVFTTKAEAATEIEIYRATNTYDEKTIEKDKKVAGYERNQYIITYDMDNKKTDRLVAENPSVTVFTHGYNSSARDWLNNAADIEKEEYFTLQYSNESMVEQVVKLHGVENSVLLIANMQDYHSVKFERYVLTTNKEGKIVRSSTDDDFEITSEYYGKHFIVVFNCREYYENDSNNNLYFQFNYMLSSILYDLKQIDPLHRIPKVNLIGHSRGGLTNMQYALDHPDIVANLISLGTPYKGSTTATLVQYDDKYNGDGLTDIITPKVYNDYQNRWNTGYNTLYKNINTLAIGAYSSLPFLNLMAHKDKSGYIEPWMKVVIDIAVPLISLYKVYTNGNSNAFGLETIWRAINRNFKRFFAKSAVSNGVEILLDEVQLSAIGPVWFSDAIVPLDSQLGMSYIGFHNYTKYFSVFGKKNLNRFAQWMPPALHNLEPWDEDIIKKVVDELTPSVVDNTANYKYKENSDGTINVSGLKAAADSNILDIPAAINGKTVRGISSGAFAGEPSVISKLNVNNTNVASYAANSENTLSNVTTINIPSTVTNISTDAFSGMESLTTVNFGSNSQLNTIGENAFADCINLRNINLPSGVTEIPYGAFENCKALESVTIPNGVTKIGAQAFSGADKLAFTNLPTSVTEIGELAFFGCKGSSSITLPSGVTSIGDGAFAGMENVTAFSISSANANYLTENGVLYNKAKTELLQYPKAKTATTFTANTSNATSYVETIKPYAFYGCENLTEVNINYASNVETMAFANCSSLATIYALGVTNAEIDAFSNTQWIENQLSNNDGKVVLGELLVLYAPENKTVMNLSDWDFSVAAIAENAFAFSDVETIYVPSSVSRWNEYAFANAQELKDVYVEKMNSSLLNSLRVKENIFGGNHEDFKLHVTRSDNAAIAAMGQNALTGIPREVISTNVTCINNGVTTTRTLYYDENYTLEEDGTVNWLTQTDNVVYQNTGVWKSFESELTLNGIAANENWLIYNGTNISPVPLAGGDIVSLSYTTSGVITVTVNGQVYTVDLNLPVGKLISSIASADGQVANLNNTVYTGQFTSFNVRIENIRYNLTYTYKYYDSNGLIGSTAASVTFTVDDDLSAVNEVLQKKYTQKSYNGNNYYIMGVYDNGSCTNEVTSFTPGTNSDISWYLKCNRITYIVTLDYGSYTTKSNILYTSVSSSGSYSYRLPSYSRSGYTVTWVDKDSKASYTPGTTVTLSGSRSLKLTFTCANHVIIKRSISDTQHEEKCDNCGYRKVSAHNIITSGTVDNLYYHTKKCKQCDYEYAEEHDWQTYNKMFKCTICNIRAVTIPSIYDSLKFLIIDEQGNIKEISREEAMLVMKKYYETEEEGDVAA